MLNTASARGTVGGRTARAPCVLCRLSGTNSTHCRPRKQWQSGGTLRRIGMGNGHALDPGQVTVRAQGSGLAH